MSKLNIYSFFNSPDVAEHCRNIQYTGNAFESAVIVNQSDLHTLVEKHAAYRTIISEYPDMEIPEGNNHAHVESFYSALNGIIANQERKIEKLLSSEPGTVFQATVDGIDCGLFTSYEKALADALEQEKIEKLSLQKSYLDSDKWIAARLSSTGEIMEIRHDGTMFADMDEEEALLETYIDVPVPFKYGDLVEVGDYGHLFGRSPMPYGGVYVLKNICRDHKRHAERIYRGDLMDMTANVFYIRDGNVACECMHFYPDLRYCRRELAGEARILKYVSLFLKEKICACALLKLQKYLALDEMLGELKADYDLRYDLERLGDTLLNRE